MSVVRVWDLLFADGMSQAIAMFARDEARFWFFVEKLELDDINTDNIELEIGQGDPNSRGTAGVGAKGAAPALQTTSEL